MLIDISYFISGTCHIRNASSLQGATQSNTAVREMVESYIDSLQNTFLTSLLGVATAGYVTDCIDTIEDNADNIYCQVAKRIRKAFACFVAYHIVRDSSQEITVIGIRSHKSEDNEVDPVTRQVILWNTMVEENLSFIKWAEEQSAISVTYKKNMITKINDFNL